MLMELTIRDFALIERMNLEFGPGLNVLTGETGAGKSIVVDALTLALGGRADKDMIRTGCKRALVQAVFDTRRLGGARAIMEEAGIPQEEDCLILEREMGSRGLCRVNGSAVPLSLLKRLGACLCELHGQHENQSLLIPARHLGILDDFGGDDHAALLSAAASAYARFSARRRELEALEKETVDRARRADTLRREAEEISSAKLKSGEDEALEQKFRLMQNGEKISAAVEKAYRLIYEGSQRSASVQEQVQHSAAAMRGVADLDPRFDSLAKRLDELYYQAQDIGYELRDLQDGMEFDAARFEKIGARLDHLDKLKRKYGPTLAEVIAYGEQSKKELSLLANSDEMVKELKARLDEARADLTHACEALHESRMALSHAFEAGVTRELAELGMSRARFTVRLVYEAAGANSTGADDCEFYFTANPGEPSKPLSTTASGGELSRVMLGIKAVMAQKGGVDAMIFDEIDTGVSGRMAQAVGEKLARIGFDRQVIAVSHLPQIAALADRQYLVEKTTDGERTGTGVRLLDDEGRAMVLSGMIGGADDHDTALAHARTLLESEEKWKSDRRGQGEKNDI